MSFIAKLYVDDEEEINVLHCGFRFTQTTDATGKPSSVPLGGTITMVLESNGETGLFTWMISPSQMKNGRITFYRRDTMSKLKSLEFKDAHCVDYYETFHHSGKEPMQIELTISARQIKLNDTEFVNYWPE